MCLWIGVIFFSCTSLAGEWSEALYSEVSGWFGSSSQLQGSETLHFIAEKGVHFTLFFILAVLLWNALPGRRWPRFMAILAIALLIGCCSEFLQRFFPGRDPAIRDVLINFGSAAAGACVSIAFTSAEAASR